MAVEDEPMSRYSFSIAYDGDARPDEHAIEVETLAPALLGFGKLIREANHMLNGESSKVKVLVVSDFEHKCFQINFEAVQSIYESVKSFLDMGPIKTAKEVLEWVGLVPVFGGGSYLSYLMYMKVKRGRKVVSQRQIIDENGQGMIAVTVAGDNNEIVVHNHVYELSENSKVAKATKEALSPIGKDGFTSISMKDGGKTIDQIQYPEAIDILASCETALSSDNNEQPNTEVTTAWLTVYAPVFDEKAPRWRFKLGTEHVYVDISETSIAKDAIARGGSMLDDTYYVKLEISKTNSNDRNSEKNTYKVLEVLRFIPAPTMETQTEMSLENDL